jgi:putative endonuclease
MPNNEKQSPQSGSPKFFYVYILHCNDGGIYTGCTSNLKERFYRHQKGWVPITKERLPVRLAWCGAFPERTIAFEFEQYLKSGSGRAFAKKHLLVKL